MSNLVFKPQKFGDQSMVGKQSTFRAPVKPSARQTYEYQPQLVDIFDPSGDMERDHDQKLYQEMTK